ncbi:ImuA family protein [Ancylobacter sp. IITR112]|uniref:ImuA family protein n=1 Tax=Ancylobacter sp. IITR112 TaxID=3138073 RepID=UPI00352AD141
MDPIRDVAALRQMLAGLEAERLPGVDQYFSLGAAGPEAGGVRLARGALHEVQAVANADMPAATGFVLALAQRARPGGAGEGRPLVWVRQDMAEVEFGRLDAPGFAALGLDPARLLLVRARDGAEVLRAAGDAVRCAGLGGLLIEIWGTPKALDLTATRRLGLRASSSGVTSFLLHAAAQPAPTAVATRWRVAPAASLPLEGDAPGAPAFRATLLRHRGGEGGRPVEGGDWTLEWDHEACTFRDLDPLSRAVVPVPAGRPDRAAAPEARRGDVLALRRAG